MSGTSSVIVGDKGRIVVPAEIRARRNWSTGTALVLVETADGMLVTERETALAMFRARATGGPSVVDSLIAERRAEATADEA